MYMCLFFPGLLPITINALEALFWLNSQIISNSWRDTTAKDIGKCDLYYPKKKEISELLL